MRYEDTLCKAWAVDPSCLRCVQLPRHDLVSLCFFSVRAWMVTCQLRRVSKPCFLKHEDQYFAQLAGKVLLWGGQRCAWSEQQPWSSIQLCERCSQKMVLQGSDSDTLRTGSWTTVRAVDVVSSRGLHMMSTWTRPRVAPRGNQRVRMKRCLNR